MLSKRRWSNIGSTPGNEPKWTASYLKKPPPPDPWGNPYQYKYPDEQADFALLSFGRDGRRGGSGDDADIAYR